MAGHAQLDFVMTECSKTQIRLTGLIYKSNVRRGFHYIALLTHMCIASQFWDLGKQCRKVNGKVQGVPQSQTAASPCHQEEEKLDRNYACKIN